MIVSRCNDSGLVKSEDSPSDADAHYQRSVSDSEALEAFEKELKTRAIQYLDPLDNNEIIDAHERFIKRV